ncbi:MAG TPA: tetratricopeptide repeat protein [Candidatus Acidoferrales bacterium]|nr:tetratricopeptide repeat protein [Candidatus Acidoferrales bacterium]
MLRVVQGETQIDGRRIFRITALWVFLCAWVAPPLFAQQNARQSPAAAEQESQGAANGESELQTGTSLTSEGHFAEAVPHLQAARGHVTEEYAASFNLALCYVALHKPKLAIPILDELQRHGQGTPGVWNLLAQAYAGEHEDAKAFEALKHAAASTPRDEKLYAYVADACLDAHENELGLKVVDEGLESIPHSARLHYQRAVFLTALDEFERARNDFDLAAQLAPGSDISYISSAHKALIEGDLAEVVRVSREGIAEHKDGYILLSMLGQALLRSGTEPGQPEFSEARNALEKSIAENPGYAQSRISLAQVYLLEDRLQDAIAQLDAARALDPKNPAVYSHLAAALRRTGDKKRLQEVVAVLAALNQRQVTQIRDAGKSGEHRGNIASVRNQ